MAQDASQFLESFIRDVINIIGQVGRTFRDMIIRPGVFARDIVASEEAPQKYIGAYTFLIVTGFLGTNALLAILTFHSLLATDYMEGDTLQEQPGVFERVSSLPTTNSLLVFGVPLVISIVFIACLFRISISKSRDKAVSQAVYYTTGAQYFLFAIFYILLYLFEWKWDEWSLSSWLADALQGWMAYVLIIVLAPATLLFRIALCSVDLQSRRAGRGFVPLAFVAALIVQVATAILPWVGMTMYAIANPVDVRKLAIFQTEFLGRPVVNGNRIEAVILLTNQTSNNLFIQSGKTLVTTSSNASSGIYHGQPKEWEGRLYDPRIDSDIVSVKSGETVALRFNGEYKGDVGLTNEARGRLEVMRISSDGSTKRVIGYMRLEEFLWDK